MKKNEVIAYYRRSTKNGQIHSLEAQQLEVEEFCRKQGLKIIETFQETESGKSIERPILQQAIKTANAKKIPIVILRLDRLGRTASEIIDLAFQQKLIIAEHGIQEYDRFAINLMATFAEKERELISKRTKQGLQAAKARGVKLGNPNLRQAQQVSAQKQRQQALLFAQKMQSLFGTFSQLNNQDLADSLNEWSIPTRSGRGKWHPEMVRRVRNRISRDY